MLNTNYGTILRPEEFYRDARTQTRNKRQSRKIRDVYKLTSKQGQSRNQVLCFSIWKHAYLLSRYSVMAVVYLLVRAL
jgi:hypothetical protein